MQALFTIRRSFLLSVLLLCALGAGGGPNGFSHISGLPGTGGGPIAGSVHVAVVRAGSDDGTGQPLPVPGAFVMVGGKAGNPFAGNWGIADGNGVITFTNPALTGPQSVTAGADGYQFYSFVDVNAAQVVIPLALKDPVVPTSEVSGSLTDFAGVNCDNWLQTGLVFPPLDLKGLVGFDLAGQMTERVPVVVLGQTLYLPSNLVIPTQKEFPTTPGLCWLLGVNISKPTYLLNLPTGTTQNLFSFGMKLNMAGMSGGGLDFSDIVPLEIGIARNVAISGNMTVNIPMMSALTLNLTLATNNTPASYSVLLLSLGEINGDLGQAPGGGDLALLDFTQVAAGVPTSTQLRTTAAASPFADIRYLAMAVAKPSTGSGLTGNTGVLDRGAYTPPATRQISSFLSPVQQDPVAGDLFGFSDTSRPGVSPVPDLNLSSLSLVTTVPDTRPGAEPGATMDVTERLWSLASPGADHAFHLPILPPQAPAVLPFPEQTPATDKLVWGQTVVVLGLDPNFDFDSYDMSTFVDTFTHFSSNSRDFSVDSDADGIPLFQDNCPAVANPGQADMDGDGLGDVCDPDKDGDGYTVDQGDCNDSNAAVHPGAIEGPPGSPTCGDGLDNDCDGATDAVDTGCIVPCVGLTLGHTGTGNDPVPTPANSPGCTAGRYAVGAVVQLAATAASGWRVLNWTGTDNDATTAATNKVTMPASDRTATVHYAQGCGSILVPGRDGGWKEVGGTAALIPVLGIALILRARGRAARPGPQ